MNDYYSLLSQVVAGNVAGWASVTTGQPFDLMKIRFQLKKDDSLKWLMKQLVKMDLSHFIEELLRFTSLVESSLLSNLQHFKLFINLELQSPI